MRPLVADEAKWRCRVQALVALVSASAVCGAPAAAQQPFPLPGAIPAPPSPSYPAPAPGYPGVAPATYPTSPPLPTAAAEPSLAVAQQAPAKYGVSMREMFVGALALGAQAATPALVAGLVSAVTGQLTEWFNRKAKKAKDAAASPASLPPDYSAPPQFFDTQTGSAITPEGGFALAPPSAAPAGQMFAGLAFEIHAVLPGGVSTAVDPASHDFRTGDRFLVFYRPTLPGRMDVFNINPAGMQAQIDSVQLAGGQLAQLGPYEFAATKGDDRLRLVMHPCSTPELVMATRDIINVAAASQNPAPPPTPLATLPECTAPTRSVRAPVTRDIRKVGVEGTTAFALDPVTPQELTSGQVDAREVTIVFRHR